jgi:predicted GTPase
MEKNLSIFNALEVNVHNNADLSDEAKTSILRNLQALKSNKINLLVTGATGVGKSSTINALFDTNISKVGITPNPETLEISSYELGNLVIWDSPGLGDGKEMDNRHAKNIISKLNELDQHGNLLIDLVLVLLDASSKDLGTSYELINNVIIPNLGAEKSRIIVALNQADQAMKGRFWNAEKNFPEPKLVAFLDEKVDSTKCRILDSTGITIEPIYFCAGYKDGSEEQKPYNLSKLLYLIIKNSPKEKRIAYIDNISRDQGIWESNDDLVDYNLEIKKTLWESVVDGASKGAGVGANIGKVFGPVGESLGRVLGGVVGGLFGFFS